MRLSKREKVLIGILVILGVGYVIDRFMLYPAATCHKQLLASEAGLENQLQQLENLTAEYGTERQQELVETNYRKVLAQIPPSPMVPSIMDFLQSSAADTGVEVVSVSYRDAASLETRPAQSNQTTSKTPGQQLDFQMEARGDYGNLVMFVQRIETAPRLYIITKVKIVLPQDLSIAPAGSEMPGDQTGMEQDNPPDSNGSDQIPPITARLFLEFRAYYYDFQQ